MGKQLGIGIVGYGKVGSLTHRTWIGAHKSAELAAVFDTTEVRRQAAERDNPGISVYGEYGAFLADSSVEAVVIATPPNSHCELTIEAIRQGKHVFVDKPFAMNAEEARRMIDAAEAGKLVVHCHQSRRYDGEYQSILACVRAGRIGRVEHVRRIWSQYGETWANWGIEGFNPSWRIQRIYGGGMVYDYAPHCGDQLLRLIDRPLRQVYSDVRSIRFSTEVDDHFSCLLRFEGGATAYLEAGNLSRLPGPHWYVTGSKGCISADSVDGPIQILADGMEAPETLPPIHRRDELYDNFVSACRGEASPSVTPAHLVATMKLIDAVFLSAKNSKPVDLE